MQSDDEAPLTLSKWPFYLGDILLVLTALAIAILGKWQLTDMQVVSCVLAVALGAAIFVLPYIVEHSMRVREMSDDRDAEIRMLKGYLQKAESALGQYHERLQELESGSGSVDQRCELLASAVDQKLLAESERMAELSQQLTTIEPFKAEQVEALAALKAELEAQIVALRDKAQEPEAPSEAVLALQAELAALATRVAESSEPLAAIESRLAAVEANTPPTEPEDERPARVSRKRRVKSDSGLLHRAIEVKQDSASSAVSRIIDSKNKLVEPEPAAETDAQEVAPEPVTVEPEPEAVVAEEPASAAPVVEESPSEGPAEAVVEDSVTEELVVELDPEVASTGMEDIPEDFEVSLGADLIEDEELLAADALEAEQVLKSEAAPVVVEETVVEPEPEKVVPTEPEPKEAPEETAADTVAEPKPEGGAKNQAKDLFGEVESAPARRARTKEDDAIFSVSILIGIGNKPFLRGSGGGLSWESGIPMDFEEIGKWRWVAPADMEAPIELQVFRNDEDADRKGRYTLNPGQKLEVSPVF